MPPSPSLPRRLAAFACVLGAAAILLLPGCGDDGAATAGRSAPAQTRVGSKPSAAKRGPAAAGCPAQAGTFVEAMDTLRHQLAVGLSYGQYAARVRALRRGYDRIPTSRVSLACLMSTGTPAEAALNKYIDAAKAWGQMPRRRLLHDRGDRTGAAG